MKKIDIGENAKVLVRFDTENPVVTDEETRNIVTKFSEKYGIPEKNIKIEVNYTSKKNGSTVLAGDVVDNIYDPQFQHELMKQWASDNNIAMTDDDFAEIVKIDSQINSVIDTDKYNNSKKYDIKWIRWSNFLSYGPDNYFDFTTLKGIVLLNGQPANKSGKSTFAYDLLHFLLFGKTNTDKAKTLSELFNNYLPDEKTVTVEGCISIDGEDYLIKRCLTRPNSKKTTKTKTVTNKVEYYKLLPNGTEELLPDENNSGESSKVTSKLIKDAIGNESDFDLIISANAKDLDALITLTETERGRLLSRWIGLSVIEEKDIKAREKWNKDISVGRVCDTFNREQLVNDINALEGTNKTLTTEIENNAEKIKECDAKIESYNKTRDTLLLAKQSVDDKLLKIDVKTLETTIETITEKGKKSASDLRELQTRLAEFGNIDFSEDEYNTLKTNNNSQISRMAELRSEIKQLQATNTNLANAEFCPTCKRKLDNVDNSGIIAQNNIKIKDLTNEGVALKAENDKVVSLMGEIEDKRKKFMEKSKIELNIAALNTEIANKRLEYQENKNLLNEVNQNKEKIAKNNQIDTEINVIAVNINTENALRTQLTTLNTNYEKEISTNISTINTKKGYITKIDEEIKTEKYWKMYLQMIGKDGISKIVLRNTLPIINSELNRLLSDTTDFRVEVTMNEKNDVDFILIRNDVRTRLSAASGLEKTQASLALRVVLGKLSKMPKPPFILLDEVLGTVAKENYDDMKKIYDKIAQEFSFILHITHLSEIADWHENIVTVIKENNISSIKK